MKVVTVRNPVWGQETVIAVPGVKVHHLLTVLAHLMEQVELILLLLL